MAGREVDKLFRPRDLQIPGSTNPSAPTLRLTPNVNQPLDQRCTAGGHPQLCSSVTNQSTLTQSPAMPSTVINDGWFRAEGKEDMTKTVRQFCPNKDTVDWTECESVG